MIGIIYSLFQLGVMAADGVRKCYENEQGIKRAQERKAAGTDNTNTYFDWRGARRDLDTHEYRSVDFLAVEQYGEDQCIRDIHGNVVRNLSEERRDVNYRYAQTHNNGSRTVMLYKQKYTDEDFSSYKYNGNYCGGTWFKDLKTGEIYVARQFVIGGKRHYNDKFAIAQNASESLSYKVGACKRTATYYMNMDGILVREADIEKKYRKDGRGTSEEDIKAFMDIFNAKQRQEGWYGTKYPKRDQFGNTHIEQDWEKKSRKKEYYCNKDKVVYDV